MRWLGFHDAASTRLSDIIKRSTSYFDLRRTLETVEPSFDETDELALKCFHYTVAEGKNHSLPHNLQWLHNYSNAVTVFNQRPQLPVKTGLCPSKLQRSGHICSLKSKTSLAKTQVHSNQCAFDPLKNNYGADTF